MLHKDGDKKMLFLLLKMFVKEWIGFGDSSEINVFYN